MQHRWNCLKLPVHSCSEFESKGWIDQNSLCSKCMVGVCQGLMNVHRRVIVDFSLPALPLCTDVHKV